MKRLFSTSILLTQIMGVSATSLCERSEHVVFNCRIQQSAKVVSLCAAVGSVKGEQRATTLFYRFGKPGSTELQFPRTTDGSLQNFRLHHYFRPQLDSTSISFSSDAFTYSVFDSLDTKGHSKLPERTSGVSVSGKRKVGAELNCHPGSVKANWFLIDGVIPCEEDEGTPNSCNYKP